MGTWTLTATRLLAKLGLGVFPQKPLESALAVNARDRWLSAADVRARFDLSLRDSLRSSPHRPRVAWTTTLRRRDHVRHHTIVCFHPPK